MITSEELRALNRYDVAPIRAVRKTIFSLRLWRPARQRLHSQRRGQRNVPGRAYYRKVSVASDLSIACVNAQSVGNKAATISRTIVDDRIDIFVITETSHENSQSTTLKRIVPPGYRCIDAARPIPPGAANAAAFQNHGGLAFVYSDVIKCQKRTFDFSVSTFEYLCGLVSTGTMVTWCCLGSTDQAVRRYQRRSSTSCRQCSSGCPCTTVQSSSAVISTFMSTVQMTSTPRVWINCCSRSAAYSTSPSRHTTPATYST